MFLRSFLTVGGLTGISRVLGFFRDILIAGLFGTSFVADAFFVAVRLPNLFRRLCAEGAFSAAFVPVYASTLEEEGIEKATIFANDSFALLTLTVGFGSIIAVVFMPAIVNLLAPGFAANPETFNLTVVLSRITFIYLLFMALTAHLSGILNSHNKFAAAAGAPVLLNVIYLIALLIVIPYVNDSIHVLAFSVALAGLAQFILVFYAVRRIPVNIKAVRPRLTQAVRKLFRLMGPGLITGGAQQINLLVGTIIASTQAGAVSYLYYADRVYQLPLGLIGVGLGVVLLPKLTTLFKGDNPENGYRLLNSGVEISLLLTLPAAVALFVIAEPVMIGLFERGAFDRSSSIATAHALMAYAIGLPSFVLVKVLAPGFFARQNTRTPMYYALWTMALNVVLALILSAYWGFVGIALATTIAGWANALLLGFGLYRKGFWRIDPGFIKTVVLICLACLIMGASLVGINHLAESWIADNPYMNLLKLVGLVVGGIIVFAIASIVTGAASPARLKKLLLQK
jgi:putative peptidoglycan lipid II flippase